MPLSLPLLQLVSDVVGYICLSLLRISYHFVNNLYSATLCWILLKLLCVCCTTSIHIFSRTTHCLICVYCFGHFEGSLAVWEGLHLTSMKHSSFFQLSNLTLSIPCVNAGLEWISIYGARPVVRQHPIRHFMPYQ